MSRKTSKQKKHQYFQRNLAITGVIVIFMGLMTFSIWFGRPTPRPSPNTGATTPNALNVTGADPKNGALVTQGKQVYATYCASCHGINLEGQANWKKELPGGGRPAPPHDETGHTWHHDDQLLFAITKYGGQANSPPDYRNNMPAYEKILKDEDIWAVLAYIKSTWPPEILTAQEETNQKTR